MCMHKYFMYGTSPVVSSNCPTTVITVLTTVCTNLHNGYLEIVVTYIQLYLSTGIKAIYYVSSALLFEILDAVLLAIVLLDYILISGTIISYKLGTIYWTKRICSK